MNIKNLETAQIIRIPNPNEDLIEELKDTEFKSEFGAEQAKLEFAVVLRNARNNAKLTQEQFAEMLGRTQPYIAKLEGGEANPTLAAVGKMFAVLDLKISLHTVSICPDINTVSSTAYLIANDISSTIPVTTDGPIPSISDWKSIYPKIYSREFIPRKAMFGTVTVQEVNAGIAVAGGV